MEIHFLVLTATICIFATGTNSLDGEMAELAKMLRESCIEETGADVALIEQVNAGADLMPDPKLKCYIKCVMETAGMMSEGTVDVEAVVAVLPEELLRHADTMRACDTQRGSDACDTAFRTQQCWQRGSRDGYFLI